MKLLHLIFGDPKDACYRGGTRHCFHARHEERSRPGKLSAKGTRHDTSASFMDALRRYQTIQHYCGDVCRWCGKVTNVRDP